MIGAITAKTHSGIYFMEVCDSSWVFLPSRGKQKGSEERREEAWASSCVVVFVCCVLSLYHLSVFYPNTQTEEAGSSKVVDVHPHWDTSLYTRSITS